MSSSSHSNLKDTQLVNIHEICVVQPRDAAKSIFSPQRQRNRLCSGQNEWE